MYERYKNASAYQDFFETSDFRPVPSSARPAPQRQPPHRAPPPAERQKSNALSGLFENIKLPEFNADTLILLLMVFFLLGEDDDNFNIGEMLIIVAILLLLGF